MLFAREGARVVIVDVNPAAAEVTAGLIGAEGGQCVTITADVARDDDCAAVTKRALDMWGRLDVLHHNVGVSSVGSVVDLPDHEWDRLLTVQEEPPPGYIASSRIAREQFRKLYEKALELILANELRAVHRHELMLVG